MELESALEIVRRHHGPVTQIGLPNDSDLHYILESTGETYPAKELLRLASQLQEREERLRSSS
jgi:hypothetical protein